MQILRAGGRALYCWMRRKWILARSRIASRERRRNLAALLFLGSAVAAAFVAGVEAIRIEGVDLTLPPDVEADSGGIVAPPPAAVWDIVDTNPFRPDRRAAPVAYSPAGVLVDLDASPSSGPETMSSSVRLVGTGVVPGGQSFALLAWEGRPARLVRVGESWEGISVRAVAAGRAVLVNAGTEQTLYLAEEGR